ncbi:hypothetical protein OAB57_02685, partial [Bacteriovoracaceae bacterium]|nr:hypothetical protein [Bacteriovoracaceae bacterium]
FSYSFNSAGDKYSSSEYDGKIFFENLKYWNDRLSHISLLDLKKERDGDVSPIRYQINFGPIGFKYHFPKFWNIEDLSLSYIPTYEFYSADRKIFTNSFDYNLIQVKDSYMRHQLHLSGKLILTPKLSIENTTKWRPKYEIASSTLDLSDSNFLQSLQLKYSAYPNISISYRTTMTWDTRKKLYLDLPSTEWENSIYFFYTLQLDTKTF